MSKKVTTVTSTNTGLAILMALLFPLGYLVYIKGIYDPTNVPRFLFTSAVLLGALWMLKESSNKGNSIYTYYSFANRLLYMESGVYFMGT
jgi:hypothetical protein